MIVFVLLFISRDFLLFFFLKYCSFIASPIPMKSEPVLPGQGIEIYYYFTKLTNKHFNQLSYCPVGIVQIYFKISLHKVNLKLFEKNSTLDVM